MPSPDTPAGQTSPARWATVLTHIGPSVRWRLGKVKTDAVYRRAFGSLGPGTVIVQPKILRGVDRIHLGRDVAVYAGAWLQCEDNGGPLTVGDRTYLGHDVHLHAIDPVTIGSDCVLADGAFIASTDHVRGDRSKSAGTGPVIIGDRVFIGQRAVILGGVRIGDDATIGAGAVVTKDVPAHAVAAGVPARVITGGTP